MSSEMGFVLINGPVHTWRQRQNFASLLSMEPISKLSPSANFSSLGPAVQRFNISRLKKIICEICDICEILSNIHQPIIE